MGISLAQLMIVYGHKPDMNPVTQLGHACLLTRQQQYGVITSWALCAQVKGAGERGLTPEPWSLPTLVYLGPGQSGTSPKEQYM